LMCLPKMGMMQLYKERVYVERSSGARSSCSARAHAPELDVLSARAELPAQVRPCRRARLGLGRAAPGWLKKDCWHRSGPGRPRV
jgi:hypothetical protein